MPDYFNIPLGNHPALIQLQNYLRTQLPEGTTYQEPETFHITLVTVQDSREQDLTQFPFPNHIPRFGITGMSFDTFDEEDNERYPLVVRLLPSESLKYLQADLFYKLQAQGVKLSRYSYPGSWNPHITVAYVTERPEEYIPFPEALALEVNQVALTGEGYTTQATWNLEQAVMVQEILQTVWEFKGSYPDIPVNPVVLKTIQEDDPAPFFTTLKIGEVGGYSRNRKRPFSRGEVQRIVEEVNSKKPEGRVGHHDLSTRAQSLPHMTWLGATLDETTGIAWGKAYVYPHAQDVRQFIKLQARNNAPVGTSIFGLADEDENGEWNRLIIQAIDLAGHADGISVQSLQTLPVVTQEFIQSIEGESTMQKSVEELTRDLSTIAETLGNPADLLKAVKELHAAATQQKTIATLLGNPADVVKVVQETVTKVTTLETQVSELTKGLTEANAALLDNEIEKTIAEMVQLDNLRPTVRTHVTMQRRVGEVRDLATAKAAITAYLAEPATQFIAEALVAKAAGGNAIVSMHKRDELPSEEALQAMGRSMLGKR